MNAFEATIEITKACISNSKSGIRYLESAETIDELFLMIKKLYYKLDEFIENEKIKT